MQRKKIIFPMCCVREGEDWLANHATDKQKRLTWANLLALRRIRSINDGHISLGLALYAYMRAQRERAKGEATHAEWHRFVNMYEIKGWADIPVRFLWPEAREAGLMEFLPTARKWASAMLLGGKKLDTSFGLMPFGIYKQS